jgi:hypothetical protein
MHFTDLHIIDKTARLRPLKPNRVQSALLAALTGRDLVVKPRQTGISTIVQALYFLTAISETARVTTIAHDKDTTQKLRDMAQFFYEGLPPEDRPPRIINNAARTRYPKTESWLYYSTAGNTRAGRGGTYNHVHGSEVAHWKDAHKIVAGLLQGVPKSGSIIFESGNSIWTVHFFPWWWDKSFRLPAPMLTMTDEERDLAARHRLSRGQIAWRRAKQLELGDLFRQEYPEDLYAAFLKSGESYFHLTPEMLSAPPDAPYRPNHRYVAGLDFGQMDDYTVCAILDATTYEQVDLLRVHRQSWADMRRLVVNLCLKWRVHALVAEANSIGSANIEALRQDMETLRCQTAIIPFQTTHTGKHGIIAALRLALEERHLKLLPDTAQQHELQAFTSRQSTSGIWQLTAPAGTHDDCVIALALANHAIGTGSLILFST